ncbi:MAG: hypothetical protein V7644_824 [Actinomycetota bacterium]
MEGEEAARLWVEGWSRGWRAHDPEPIAARYSAGAVFVSHPFREPLGGRDGAYEYARQAFSAEDTAEFRFAEPIVCGRRAAVEYWAVLTSGGREQTLAGTTVLHFDDDGLVDRHCDYWALEGGARQPPLGWGA